MKYLLAPLPSDITEPAILCTDLVIAEELARKRSAHSCVGVWEYNETDQQRSWLVVVACEGILFRRE